MLDPKKDDRALTAGEKVPLSREAQTFIEKSIQSAEVTARETGVSVTEATQTFSQAESDSRADDQN